MGTQKKVYLEDSGALSDITPIRRTVTLGTNPLNTSGGAGSGVITVTDNAHGVTVGSYVTFSSSMRQNLHPDRSFIIKCIFSSKTIRSKFRVCHTH